jgi:hypothetical protein
MKNSNRSRVLLDTYKGAGYSDEIIAYLEYLTSQHLCLVTVLENYRYIQPDGELFSEESLQIVITLHDIEAMLESQKEITCLIEKKLRKLMTFKSQIEPSDFIFIEDAF